MSQTGSHVTELHDCFYRMKFLHEAEDILGPARAPEGRFHYGDQRALYLSASPQGCVVASRMYMMPEDPPRAIFPLRVESDRIVDLRDAAAVDFFRIDVTHRAARWQQDRAAGRPAPTWEISDRVRALGLHGMLYASRSDPEKTHLTLFDWNRPGAAQVTRAGPGEPWLDEDRRDA